MKLCACGCGRPTPPAKTTDNRRGIVKGEPLRFIPDHRGRRTKRGPVEPRLCACGCGQLTQPARKTDRRRGNVKGQPATYLSGHAAGVPGPRGPYRPHAIGPDAPKCNRRTLKGPVCRAVDCRRPMHRGRHDRRCAQGHVAHSGRGICGNCRQRMRYGTPVELGPLEQPRMRPSEVLDEWVWLGGPTGGIRFAHFAERVGLTLDGWRLLFAREQAKGDPRAVKHASDEPVRHWRAS